MSDAGLESSESAIPQSALIPGISVLESASLGIHVMGTWSCAADMASISILSISRR